jgi:hypothetical protein
MGTGAIIWTCLALTVHQAPIQEYPMSSRNLKLPIRLDPKRIQEIQELWLLVSQDHGQTWQQVDRKPPTERDFVFHAPADGSYWFIVQQVNRNGQSIPDNPSRAKPSMAVLVDSTRPQINVTAERLPSGEIVARWKATDQYPDVRSVRLDYHTSALPEGQWTPLNATPALEGSQSFEPGKDGRAGKVRVRVQMKDQAGNVGDGFFDLDATVASSEKAVVGPTETSSFNVIPTRTEQPGQTSQLTSQQRQRSSLDAAQGPGPLPASSAPPPELSPAASAPPGGLPIAQDAMHSPGAAGSSAESSTTGSPVQIVSARRVRLDFTVDKVGPSGLGNADIYVTLDKGQTWKKMPGDVPITTAPNADNHGSESVSGSVSVELPAEGVMYGFIVAAKSKAGLAPAPPKHGDGPEALVELDTTAPKGQLFKPQPDPSQPNTLLLAWEAKDRNLADKPITLEWAEQKGGPWTGIGEGPLPNTGQYAWRLPDHLPPRVFLRLTMSDVAGNKSQAQTDKPELIDLSVPQTKIIHVEANSR